MHLLSFVIQTDFLTWQSHAELSEQNNSTGSIYVTKLRTSNENTVCRSIFNDLFKQFNCKIKCGHLESNAYVVPAPIQYKGYYFMKLYFEGSLSS